MADLNPTAAAVLGYLGAGPLSGWDVAQGLSEVIGPYWNVTRSQVYRELHALAGAGLVEAGERGVRDRREYRRTPEGEAAFKDWLGEVPGPDNVRIPLLLKIFLGEDLPDSAMREFVGIHRREHLERLAAYEASLPALEKAMPRQAILMRYGLLHERAVLEWLDSLPWTDEPDDLRSGTGRGRPRPDGRRRAPK